MAKVAWIGLGVMGFPMAGHLLKKGGHDVVVYNRTAREGRRLGSPKYGAGADGRDAGGGRSGRRFRLLLRRQRRRPALRDHRRGRRLSRHGRRDGLHRSHDGVGRGRARALAGAAAARGFSFLDAPVSGGAGGSRERHAHRHGRRRGAEAFARAEPLISAYARAVTRIGPSGAGQLTKMVNQIAIAGLLQGLSEAIHFAEKAGLDLDLVMATISKGAAQSWQLENRWKTMQRGPLRLRLRGRLDAQGPGNLSRARHAATARACRSRPSSTSSMREVQEMGGARWDTSSLIARLKADAGL